MLLILFFLLTVSACTLLYMAQRHQTLLPKVLSVNVAWPGYVLLQLLGIACAARVWSVLCVVFSWLLISMLSFSLLPFIRLWRSES